MKLDPLHLNRVITSDTGLDVRVEVGVDPDGRSWYLLRPHSLPADHTFAIRTTVGWRRLKIGFEPGKFAAGLLADMSRADETGRAAFRSVLAECINLGAEVDLWVNGDARSFDEEGFWGASWTRFAMSVRKGQLELGTEDGEPDADIICSWTRRFTAAIVAILPLEESNERSDPGVKGYPEGVLTTVQANRYERDRRNRAAAISIHGTTCQGCYASMGERYGAVATGFIEVHHVTPVSQLEAGYVIDPVRDLVPLCPNCHGVAHRRVPPFTVDEIRQMLKRG